LAVLAQTLDRVHSGALETIEPHHTGAAGAAVHNDGTGPAMSLSARFLRSREASPFS
jgi:hypothetical protein